MIVAPTKHGLEFVTQNDHARLSGQLIELFPSLAQHPRRDSLIAAGHQHDNGWREVDSAPMADSEGNPVDFLALPGPLRCEIWDRGCRRMTEADPYAGALVIQHGLRLLRRSLEHEHSSAVAALVRDLAQRGHDLAEELQVDPEEVQSDYEWLDLVDLLSLVACNRWTRTFDRVLPSGGSLRIRGGEDQVETTPSLLAGTTTFEVPVRRLTQRKFNSSLDFAMALARQTWETRRISFTEIDDRIPS